MEDLGLRCTVCSERYSDDRVPRNLICGHSFCTHCVPEIILQKKCPDCQQQLQPAEVSDLVVNYPLLRLARALAGTSISEIKESSETLPSAPPSENLPSAPPLEEAIGDDSVDGTAGICHTHGSSLSHRCMSCCMWACTECLSTGHHPQPPNGKCWTLPLEEAFAEMKYSHVSNANKKRHAAEQIQKKLQQGVLVLKGMKEQYTNTALSLRNVLQEVESSFRELETKLDSRKEESMKRLHELDSMVDMLRQTETCVEEATSARALLDALDTASDCLATVDKYLIQEQHRPTPALPKILSQGKQHLNGLLEAGRNVYVSSEVSGRRRWAQVTRQDGMLHLHALREGAHASDGISIPFKTVRHLVPQQSPSVFLDVGVGCLLRGRVYIRMLGHTPRTHQALLLCSGEQGPCYKGTFFYGVHHVGQLAETLHGGDYEKNNGTGGRKVTIGIDESAVYRTEIVAGLVCGYPPDDVDHLGCFLVHLRQHAGQYSDNGFGIVTTGLDTLRSLARHHPIKDSVIQDCGLVIPM